MQLNSCFNSIMSCSQMMSHLQVQAQAHNGMQGREGRSQNSTCPVRGYQSCYHRALHQSFLRQNRRRKVKSFVKKDATPAFLHMAQFISSYAASPFSPLHIFLFRFKAHFVPPSFPQKSLCFHVSLNRFECLIVTVTRFARLPQVSPRDDEWFICTPRLAEQGLSRDVNVVLVFLCDLEASLAGVSCQR